MVAGQETPSVRERRLAADLRQMRAAIPLTGNEAAGRLGWSASKLSRIETGRTGVSAGDLEELIALYRLPETQAEYLRRLAPASRPRGWWDAYAASLSAGYATLIRLESGSRSLSSYSAVVPHALLQTPAYARHVICSTREVPPPAEVARRLVVCERRQRILSGEPGRPPLRLRAVIDEAVLRRTLRTTDGTADEEARVGQLRHLLEVSRWPEVSIRVLPFTAGLPPVNAGSFSVLSSLATGAPDVVYLENKTRIFYIDTESEVHNYARELEHLQSTALDAKASREFISAVLED